MATRCSAARKRLVCSGTPGQRQESFNVLLCQQQQSAIKNPTLVLRTARGDLDGQLYQLFCMARDLLK